MKNILLPALLGAAIAIGIALPIVSRISNKSPKALQFFFASN